MNEEFNKWHIELLTELNKIDRSFNRLYDTVVEMKDNGVSKEQAYELLDAVRKSCSTETEEDFILELMDIVVGYCSPGKRIWY